MGFWRLGEKGLGDEKFTDRGRTLNEIFNGHYDIKHNKNVVAEGE